MAWTLGRGLTPPLGTSGLTARGSIAIVVAFSAIAGCSSGVRDTAESRVPVWYHESRSLDLNDDGRGDTVEVVAVGRQVDSLDLRLIVTIDDKAITMAAWDAGYQLIRYHTSASQRADTSEAAKAAEMRRGLHQVLSDLNVEVRKTTAMDFEATTSECAPDPVACIREDLGVSRARATEIRDEIFNAPTAIVGFSYGYESTVVLAWSRRLGRFVRLMACC